MAASSTQKAAEWYRAAMGWRVVADHGVTGEGVCRCKDGPECKSPGKHPRSHDWLNQASDPIGRDDNIAVVTGAASGGLLVIDCDGQVGVDWADSRQLGGLVCKTNRGRHHYFRHTGAAISSGRLGPGVEIKWTGSKVTLPPSTHAMGTQYEWQAPGPDGGLIDAPGWLIDEIVETQKPAPPVALPDWRASAERLGKWQMAALVSESDSLSREGSGWRNSSLNRAAYKLGQTQVDEGAAWGALAKACEVNGLMGDDGFNICRKTFLSGFRAGLQNPRTAATIGQPSRIELNEVQRNKPTDTAPRRVFDRASHVQLANALLEDVRGGGPECVYDEGDLYRCEDGIWRVVPESECHATVTTYDGALYRNGITKDGAPKFNELCISYGHISGANKIARDIAKHATPDEFFSSGPVCFACGDEAVIWEGDDYRIEPLGPQHRQRFRIGTRLGGRCPTWERYLDTVWGDAPDKLERAALLQEFFGAAILGISYRYERSLVLFGDGGNGKSVTLEVISGLFDRSAIATVPPHRLGSRESAYWMARLIGKRLNAVDETPAADMEGSQAFKAVSTGNRVEARQPGERAVDFLPRVASVFSANRLWGTSDHTDGYWRRWALLVYDHKIPADEKDRTIGARIVRDEMGGVLLWALEGARRLVGQNGYTEPATSVEQLGEWRSDSDQAYLWMVERATPVPANQGTKARVLYRDYVEWSKDTGGHRSTLSERSFLPRLRALGVEYVKNSAMLYGLVLRTKLPT